MKKMLYFILIVLVSLIIPNVNAKDDVSIESIRLIDKSEKIVELSAPTKNGLKIGFDLSFGSLGDYAKYEVVIKNDSNKEYEINDETKFSSSNYIEYKYEFKEKTNRVKANSKVTLYITVTYKNAVPNDKLTDGKYIEKNEMAISLSNEDNPKTFSSILYILLFIILILGFTFIINNKNLKNISIVIIVLLLVPVTIFALEKLRLDVSTIITIEEKYKVVYVIDNLVKESEMDSLSLTPGYEIEIKKCSDYKYIIAGTNYKDCAIDVYAYFSPGERVQIADIPNVNIRSYATCEVDSTTHTVTCPDESVLTNGAYYSSFVYYKSMYEDDKEVMNFDHLSYDYWNSADACFGFVKPNSFTMPHHDVYFAQPRR